jgi:hypothetical protein
MKKKLPREWCHVTSHDVRRVLNDVMRLEGWRHKHGNVFYFGIFLKFITITYNVGFAWFLCHWVSKKHVMPMQVYRSFGENKIWRLEVNINFGISFHFFLKIHISSIQRWNHGSYALMSFWGGAPLVWEILGHLETNVFELCSWAWKGGVSICMGLVLPRFLLPISCIGKHPSPLSTNGEMLHH